MSNRSYDNPLPVRLPPAVALCLAATLFVTASAIARVAGPLPEELFPQLKPYLEKSLDQSPQMLLKNIEMAQAEASVYLSRSALWPQLGAGGGYSINESEASERTSNKSRSDGASYSLSISQPLFHWGTLRAQAASAKIGVMIAEKNYAEAYRALIVSVRSQYLGLIVKKLTRENAKFAAEQARSILETEEQKLEAGRIAAGDIILVRLSREEAELNSDRATEDFEQARRYFLRITGASEIADDQIPMDIPDLSYDLRVTEPLVTKFVQSGVEETLLATSYQYYIEQAQINYKIAKYRLFPKLSVSMGVTQAFTTNVSQDIVSQTGVFSKSASLSWSWPLFDGFATRGAKLHALQGRRYYERILANYLETTSEQARVLGRQVEFAARAMQIATVRKDVALGSFTQTQSDAEAGMVSQAAVERSRSNLNSSKLGAASSRVEFLNRWSELISLLEVDPAMDHLPANIRAYAKSK